MRVVMFLRNPCTHDVRVLKEAKSLSDCGDEVTVVAVMGRETPQSEERDGFRIVRVPVYPLHYSLLRRYREMLSGLSRWGSIRKRFQVRALRLFRRMLRLPSVLVSSSVVGGTSPSLSVLLPEDDPGTVGSSAKASAPIKGNGWRVRPEFFKPVFFAAAVVAVIVGVVVFLLVLPLWLTIGSMVSVFLCVSRLPRLFYEPLKTAFLTRPLHTYFIFLDYAARAVKVARELRPQVCHAHDLATLPVAFLVSRRVGARLIYDSHEINTEMGFHARAPWIVRWLSRRYEGYLARRSDAVITVNRSISGLLSNWYRIAPPCVVMNCPPKNGVPPRTALFHEELGLPSDTRVVLYHGNLSQQRGLEQLVRAVAFIPTSVRLVIMGTGLLREGLERLAESEKCGGRITFREPVLPGEILPYVASADLGVVLFEPVEMNNYFASPNKLFDYLMAGVPVIASDLPEIARLVDSLKVGCLVNQGDPIDIGRGVVEVLESDDYGGMRDRARRAAIDFYNWEKQAQGLLGIYAILRDQTAGR